MVNSLRPDRLPCQAGHTHHCDGIIAGNLVHTPAKEYPP